MSVGKHIRNASRSRRSASPAAPAANAKRGCFKKSKIVSKLPSWPKPNPRLFVCDVKSRPTFLYMSRSCGTFSPCDSPMRLGDTMMPLSPVGNVWQAAHAVVPLSSGAVEKSVSPYDGSPGNPGTAIGTSSSNVRYGFGGNWMVAMNVSRSAICDALGAVSAPRRSVKPTLNAAMFSRSPRQCSGSVPTLPTSVCVIIGPFIGCQSLHVPERPVPVLQGWSSVFIAPVGSPRSHASVSRVASTWQPAHAKFPSCDVWCASYSSGRPVLIIAGVGSKNVAWPTTVSVPVLIDEIVPSKRFQT